jgi:transposase InsO family protein
MRFAFIRRHEDTFRIMSMCRVLSVTRQGYHAWKKRPPSVRALADEALLAEIRASHQRSKRSYGSPRVYRQLRRQGRCVGEKRVARLMAQDGLRAKRSQRFRTTTDSRNTKVVHENVLARDFAVGSPGRAWAGDITYLWTQEGWLYLAVVLDVGTRRVIGWSFRETLEAELVTAALDMALGARAIPAAGLICHSDRGSQYGSEDVQAMIERYRLTGSMSRKGDCWDNAVVESLFASLKTELVADARWETRAEARSAVLAWIEGWYNRERLHSTLGYLSPVEYETQLAAKTN